MKTLILEGTAHREKLRLERDPTMGKFLLTLFAGTSSEMNCVLDDREIGKIIAFVESLDADDRDPDDYTLPGKTAPKFDDGESLRGFAGGSDPF